MNEKTPSLFDALSAGITSGEADNGAGDETETQETAAPETETQETETPAGEEAEGEEEGAEGEEAEGEDEGAEGEEAEGEDEGAEGEEGAPKKPAAKEPDPLNDPIPKGTLIPTQKRVEKLIGMVKERDTKVTTLETRAQTAESERDEIIHAITDSGMDANKFGVLLDYARGRNSGDPDQMEGAYKILMGELTSLAEALGMPVPGKNPLAAHPDLVKAVEEKKITSELAFETALNRNRTAARTKLAEARTTVAARTSSTKQEQASGEAALGALGKELRAADGDAEYTRKAKIAVDMLKDVMPNMSPKLWAQTFKNVYAKIPAAPKAPPKVPPKKGAAPQPMRGNKRPSGNAAKGSPKTLLDAVKGAFGSSD